MGKLVDSFRYDCSRCWRESGGHFLRLILLAWCGECRIANCNVFRISNNLKIFDPTLSIFPHLLYPTHTDVSRRSHVKSLWPST